MSVLNYLSCPSGFGAAGQAGRATLLAEMQEALGLKSLIDVLLKKRLAICCDAYYNQKKDKSLKRYRFKYLYTNT